MNKLVFWTAVFIILLTATFISNSQSAVPMKVFSDTAKVVTILSKPSHFIIINTNKYNYVLSSLNHSGFVPIIRVGDSLFEYYEQKKLVGLGVGNEMNLFEILDKKRIETNGKAKH